MEESSRAQFVFEFGNGHSAGDPARLEVLGGKGASLAAMSRAGLPVPPGFTISAECCAWVEAHGGKWPAGLEAEVRGAVAQLEQRTNRTFGRGPRPLLVAVRSGAAVSMPGMMDTILNCGLHPALCECFPSPELFWREYADHIRMFVASVAGISLSSDESSRGWGADRSHADTARRFLETFETRAGRPFPRDPWQSLVQCIDAVFASWHSERARVYRQHHDVRGAIGTAVTVQAMFPSERSGVLFTVNPNDPAGGEMILEASWGLGEAVVSGAVTPDIYVLDAITRQVKRVTQGTRPGSEPALSDQQIADLAALGHRVEAYFQAPSDIEWGIAEGQIALLQSRRIRGLEVVADGARARTEEIERLRRLAQGEPVVWVIHNLAETLPAPTPLTWDLVRWFMSADGGYGQMYRYLGQPPHALSTRADADVDEWCSAAPVDPAARAFRTSTMLELIAGRIFADPRRLAQFHYGKLPYAYDADDILRDRTVLDRPPSRFRLEEADALFFFRLPGLLASMWRAARRSRRLEQTARERFDQQAVPRLGQFLDSVRAIDLSQLTTPQLLDELRRRHAFVLGEFAAESLLPGFFGGLAHGRLRAWCVQLRGTDDGEEWAGQLTTGLDDDLTVRQNTHLFEVARGQRSLDQFLEEFGHRAVNEMELSQPRWSEDATYVCRIVEHFRASHATSPRDRHAVQAAARRQAEVDFPSTLARHGGSSLRERIELDLRRAQRLIPYRETGKYHLMRGYATLRAVLVELGHRWDLGRDVFFLRDTELGMFERRRTDLDARIASRKLRWRSFQKLAIGDIVDSRQLANFGYPPPPDATQLQQFDARPIAAGHGIGTARIVFDPREAADLGRDYVLVCPSTDPGWTPLFVMAKGLIVERGGVLSHGAIVARDFGIPAVVCEQATSRIPNGSRVEIDAHHGRITLRETT